MRQDAHLPLRQGVADAPSMRANQKLLIAPQNRGINALVASMANLGRETIDKLVSGEDMLHHGPAGQEPLLHLSSHCEWRAIDSDTRQLYNGDALQRQGDRRSARSAHGVTPFPDDDIHLDSPSSRPQRIHQKRS